MRIEETKKNTVKIISIKLRFIIKNKNCFVLLCKDINLKIKISTVRRIKAQLLISIKKIEFILSLKSVQGKKIKNKIKL